MPKGTWLSTKLEKAYQKHSVKKEQQFYQNMLRGNDYRGTDIIFNQNTLAWLVVIVTVFLHHWPLLMKGVKFTLVGSTYHLN